MLCQFSLVSYCFVLKPSISPHICTITKKCIVTLSEWPCRELNEKQPFKHIYSTLCPNWGDKLWARHGNILLKKKIITTSFAFQNERINQWQPLLLGRLGMLLQTTTAHKIIFLKRSYNPVILFQTQLNYSHYPITGFYFLVTNTNNLTNNNEKLLASRSQTKT